MSDTNHQSLADEIGKKNAFSSPQQEAYLNLARTYENLSTKFSHLFKQHGLSAPQYNALRILRGEGRPLQIYQIAERMITRQTDITRLIERLEKSDLIKRERCEEDRRVVWITLTPTARRKLKRLDGPLESLHSQQFQGLSKAELSQLNQLLFRARKPS
ncbi:MarR family winged helix-turn-helix transcriptional regulator [Aureliella helgolandensis]|uniref:HTH-type transcriptional regulator MgrA n=1 Tax=Aureliella helgolandensis TaxID=2527968 RepID=A0A518G700_9BACT|nr:MarR family transcriptional regulator [Aureliella helgolandensis]QDV24364.1 HTH-type transcriptional regulator MgrA [Aureliella helgolandensis]